ncbi:MAG: hypothetical protein HYZ16_06680 [Bacteroidetes bacterium]|nr:hypothetical protein [Bacteroidota bacterium]
MEILLGILLYIGAIVVETPYTYNDIYDIEAQNLSTVDAVENDPVQLDASIQLWLEDGEKVIVLEEEIAW